MGIQYNRAHDPRSRVLQFHGSCGHGNRVGVRDRVPPVSFAIAHRVAMQRAQSALVSRAGHRACRADGGIFSDRYSTVARCASAWHLSRACPSSTLSSASKPSASPDGSCLPGLHHLQKVAVVGRQTELAEGEDTPSFMVLMASKNISSQDRKLQMSPRAIHHLPSCDLEKTGFRRIEPDG